MDRGLVIGKFMPPHTGHLRFFDFARSYVEALTIIVCSRTTDPIPGNLRFQWVSEMYPDCRVRHFAEAADPGNLDDPEFWDLWRTNVRRLHPEPIDYLITPEAYGRLLGDKLGARYVRSPDRGGESGTDIRADPFGCWHALPPVVRPYYARRICVHAADPVRGRDLGTALATAYQTHFVSRYEATDELDVDLARGQEAANRAGALRANRVFFVAADAFTLNGTPRGGETDPADLYLVDAEVGPVSSDGDDGLPFLASVPPPLEAEGAPVVAVSGRSADRLLQSMAAIDAHLPELRGYAIGGVGKFGA